MHKLLLALALFVSSAGVGVAFHASPAHAMKAGCVYCHGDRCGRGTIGSQWCETSRDGCIEGGESCDRT